MKGAAHLLSTACGLLMVAAVGIGTHGPARVVALAAVLVVAAAVVLRPLATLAVLLAVLVIAATSPTGVVAAVAGLSAAVYLMLRHAAASDVGLDSVSGASLVAALGFTLAGLVATAFPLQLPWLPLLAPLAIFAIYLLATRPFLGDERGQR
ncbi:hypothetical protein A5658_01925 [Mycobacterium sp. 1245111.1]|uniref:hypothetical protein n=1 Tax=Mycobacterium sp. 1245111.1 TaxID=1834073 RepID=UPI0007FFB18C|nr:hypothetical protein [Mycobacterium sp. 1245111.1]OBK33425.1 hypothetical protein A5658_01925 [Mycobacterium sp. 1245111.1]